VRTGAPDVDEDHPEVILHCCRVFGVESKDVSDDQDTDKNDGCMLEGNILGEVLHLAQQPWKWPSQVANSDKNLSK